MAQTYKRTKTNKDDAMHLEFPMKNPDTEFEWWYFDVALDNGDHFVTMYSTNDTRLKPRMPSVRTNIYDHDGTEYAKIQVYDVQDVQVSYEMCDVQIADQWCKDCGEYYELYTKIDGYGAHLKFYPHNPPYCTPASRNAMGWAVAMPSGHVEGVLFKGDVEVPVTGLGYHDHNWGTANMGANFKNWHWGKVHTDDVSIDYAIMILKKAPLAVGSALVTDRAEVLMTPSASLNPIKLFLNRPKLEDIRVEPELGLEFAHKFTLKGKSKKVKFELTVEVDHFVMRQKAKIIPGESAYRYVGNETLTVTKNGEEKTYKTSSLHEVVFLHV